jgi:uncharacterized Tic20 family protein
MTTATPPIQSALPTSNDRLWSVLSHLSWFLGVPFLLPLVVYLVMKKDSDYVAENAREALNFHISMIIYFICCMLLYLILIGIPLMVALVIYFLVCSIKAAIKASDGLCYHYPFTLRLVK